MTDLALVKLLIDGGFGLCLVVVVLWRLKSLEASLEGMTKAISSGLADMSSKMEASAMDQAQVNTKILERITALTRLSPSEEVRKLARPTGQHKEAV